MINLVLKHIETHGDDWRSSISGNLRSYEPGNSGFPFRSRLKNQSLSYHFIRAQNSRLYVWKRKHSADDFSQLAPAPNIFSRRQKKPSPSVWAMFPCASRRAGVQMFEVPKTKPIKKDVIISVTPHDIPFHRSHGIPTTSPL